MGTWRTEGAGRCGSLGLQSSRLPPARDEQGRGRSSGENKNSKCDLRIV